MPAVTQLVLSNDTLKYWIVDRNVGEVRLVFQDGREVREPINAAGAMLSSQVAVSVFDWDNWWVENVTTRGDFVVAEAYSPTTIDPLRGRKTVYLDQNHWSTVAAALTQPSRVRNENELEAALELAHLASDGGLVVPLSSAHLRETAALYGDRRYEVGVAMASLSGGWQLRHPNHVWRDEMVRTLADEIGVTPPSSASLGVVTLEPHALLDDEIRAYEMAPDSTDLFLLALSGPSVLLELLIDPVAAPAVSNLTWVDRQTSLTEQLSSSALSRSRRRSAAFAALWSDNSEPMHEALRTLGADLSALGHLTERDIPRLFGSPPMLRYFSHLMSQRLISTSTRWRENDLTDLLFLAAGAGYADYVAAETFTGTQLRQVQHARGERVSVHTTLSGLVAAIRSDGVTTIGERASGMGGHPTGSGNIASIK